MKLKDLQGGGLPIVAADRYDYPEEVFQYLPQPLAEVIQIFADYDKGIQDFMLAGSMTAIGAALYRVEMEHNEGVEYPTTNFLLIAGPSSGKGLLKYCKVFTDGLQQQRERERERDDQRPWRIFRCGGDMNAPTLCRCLKDSDEVCLIFETEADAVGKSLKGEYSDQYSTLLRKGYHREEHMFGRIKDGSFTILKHPCVAMLLSGTEDQMKPLFGEQIDNGLFSRVCLYEYNPYPKARSLRKQPGTLSIPERFTVIGKDFHERLTRLYKADTIKAEYLTEPQERLWMSTLDKVVERVITPYGEDFAQTVFREVGSVSLRIAMNLSTLRYMYDSNRPFSDDDGGDVTIHITDEDLRTALLIAQVHFNYSAKYYERTHPTLPKKEMVRILLMDKTCRLSYEEIARLCSCTKQYVAKVAKELGLTRVVR